jgi:hypothetical protein
MTDHLRVKTVVNKFNLNKDSDVFIEDSFASEVNIAILDLEDMDFDVLSVDVSTLLSNDILIKTADITYNLTEEQAEDEYSDDDEDPFEEDDDESDDEDEDPTPVKTRRSRVIVVPTVGKHPKKVTEEVFNFVHIKAEDHNAEEIADLFAGKLSIWTIKKILAVDSFDLYYTE